MELISKGIRLEICEDSSKADAKWQNLYGLKSVPDIGGSVEQIEVTNLADANKRYINGISDFGELEFGFFYNKETTEDTAEAAQVKNTYKLLRNYEKARKIISFRLIYPDNEGFQWNGTVSTVRTAAEVNAALEFTLKSGVSSEMKDVTVTPAV